MDASENEIIENLEGYDEESFRDDFNGAVDLRVCHCR